MSSKSVRRFASAAAAAAACLCLLFFPKAATASAAAAAKTWLTIIVPTLLPFWVCANLLQYSLMSALRPWQLILLGNLAGAPAGAGLCAAAAENGSINADIAARIAPLSVQPSPMFIIATVGGGLFGSISAGLALLAAQSLSCAVCCLFFGGKDLLTVSKDAVQHKSAGKTVVSALDDGMTAMLKILANMVLYSAAAGIAAALLSDSFPSSALAALTGMLEMTSGCVYAAGKLDTVRTALIICAFLTSFGGLCIFSQAQSLLAVKPRRYFTVKGTQGALAAGAMALILRLEMGGTPAMAVFEQLREYTPDTGWICIAAASFLSCAVAALLAIPVKRKAPFEDGAG